MRCCVKIGRPSSIASNSFLALAGLICLSFVGLAGCGKSGNTTTVSGNISYNGKSVPGGLINFLAQGARPQGGAINPDGTYSFELPPGDYQVRIDTPPPLPAGWKEGDPASKLPRP